MTKGAVRRAAKKILIVEDEKYLITLLAAHCAKEGFAVATARDGVEALAAARRERPDLLLLDILLPKMNGAAMLRELRKEPWAKGLPVLVLSNLDGLPPGESKEGLGAFEFMVKADRSIQEIVAKAREMLAAADR